MPRFIFIYFTVILSCFFIHNNFAQTHFYKSSKIYEQAVKYFHQGQFEQARSTCEFLTKKQARTKDGKLAHYLIALCHEHQLNFTAAVKKYKYFLSLKLNTAEYPYAKYKHTLLTKGLKCNPEVLKQYLQAEWKKEDGEIETAIVILNKLIANYPQSPMAKDALNYIIYLNFVYLRNYEQTISNCNQMLNTYSGSVYEDNTHYAMARSYEQLNQFNRAQQIYTNLLKRHTGLRLGKNFSISKLNFQSRVWYTRAKERLEMIEKTRTHPSTFALNSKSQNFGFGIADQLIEKSSFVQEKTGSFIDLLKKDGIHCKYLQHWVLKGSKLNPQYLKDIVKAGYIPVVNFWYFQNYLSPAVVKKNYNEYMNFVKNELIPYLNIGFPVLLVLEPEFNRDAVANWDGWNDFAIETIRLIKQGAPDVQIGLTPGDWGIIDIKYLKKCMGRAAQHCDFIGFQEMVSSYNETYSMGKPDAVVPRMIRFAGQLHDMFHKPIFLAYIAVSSYKGWETIQDFIIQDMFNNLNQLIDNGVFGMCYFQYLDDPEHEGYFGTAEQYFGLKDKNNRPKKSWHSWKNGIQKIISHDRWQPSIQKRFTIMPRLIDFNIQSSARIRFIFNEVVKWQLTITGATTGATRTYTNEGCVVNIDWFGESDTNEFSNETCFIELFAEDFAGNKIHFDKYIITNVITPKTKKTHDLCVLFSQSQNRYAWASKNTISVDSDQKFNRKATIKIKLQNSEKHSGVGFDFPQQLNLKTIREYGFIQLFIRSNREGGDIYLSFKDNNSHRINPISYKSGVLLSRYLSRSLSQKWQKVVIPLSAFSDEGTHQENNSVRRSHFNWEQVTGMELAIVNSDVNCNIANMIIFRKTSGQTQTGLTSKKSSNFKFAPHSKKKFRKFKLN